MSDQPCASAELVTRKRNVSILSCIRVGAAPSGACDGAALSNPSGPSGGVVAELSVDDSRPVKEASNSSDQFFGLFFGDQVAAVGYDLALDVRP